MASYTFLPWLRKGFGRNIPAGPTQFDSDKRIQLNFELTSTADPNPVQKTLSLLGPGDILGIDPKNIVRMHPAPDTSNFEPNYFPFIEFYQDTFCWDYTPEAPTGGTNRVKLNPWLVLIVVPDAPFKLIDPSQEGLPPFMAFTGADISSYFPKSTQFWAWAHLHVYDAISSVGALNAANPDFAVSRLLCPIRLEPNKKYRACVIPAYENGRLAGLGQPVTANYNAISWDGGSAGKNFPVYHSWTFQTSAEGDFETLVRRLEARPIDSSVGRQPIDVSLPAMGVPGAVPLSPPAGQLPYLYLGGALRLPIPPPEEWTDDPLRQNWKLAMATYLNKNDEKNYGSDPVVTAPLYARWQAQTHHLNGAYLSEVDIIEQNAVSDSVWLHELNLDPRRRAAAGLGARVVQNHQDKFLEMAWDQMGAIIEANQMLRQGQLAIEIAYRLWQRHVESGTDDEILTFLGPILPKIVNNCPGCSSQFNGVTAWQAWQNAGLPKAVLDPTFRGLVHPGGRLARKTKKYFKEILTKSVKPATMLRNTVAGSMALPATVRMPSKPPVTGGRPQVPQSGAPGPTPPCTTEVPLTAIINAIKAQGKHPCYPNFGIVDGNPPFNIKEELLPFLSYLPSDAAGQPAPPPYNIAQEICCVKIKANPQQAIKGKILSQLELGADLDAITPVMAYPDIPEPMYEKLMALSQDYILPNVSKIPTDTLALLVNNRPFIESFMAGLNDEMGRELLWNEFPTDQRGSYFRKFWEKRGRVAKSTDSTDPAVMEEMLKDITPIHTWLKWDFLGTHNPGANNSPADDQVVLLIRGELLLRYPDTIIYAMKVPKLGSGKFDFANPAATSYPQYSAKMPADITLLGFELTVQGILNPGANAAWFFVIRETPAGPRFGLDAYDSQNPPPSLPLHPSPDDLNWGHLAGTVSNVIDLVANKPAVSVFDTNLDWDGHAADLAAIFYQKPATVAVSALDLLQKAGWK